MLDCCPCAAHMQVTVGLNQVLAVLEAGPMLPVPAGYGGISIGGDATVNIYSKFQQVSRGPTACIMQLQPAREAAGN